MLNTTWYEHAYMYAILAKGISVGCHFAFNIVHPLSFASYMLNLCMQIFCFVHCRLRQCCCHLSLLTSALHRSESEQDQDDLDLELAMGALSLDGRPTLGANGGDESTSYQDSMPVSNH